MAQYYHHQYDLRAICPIPCNLYGPNDSFDPQRSHVLSALVKKIIDAVDEDRPEVVLWGSGIARREFMHVDDLARALLILMDEWESPDIINVGTGSDLSIRELAMLIAQKANYSGEIVWDTSMPDGMPRKCVDISKLSKLGFQPMISLEEGIVGVIKGYRAIQK